MKRFSGQINPLAFLDVDKPWAPKDGSLPTCEQIFEYLCRPEIANDKQSIVNRYKQISIESTRLFFAPAEPNILEKLVWPLKHAKSSYITGNYLGTIALCGMVAEMVAILFFEISNITINGQLMDKESQQRLFGDVFEKLRQERRVSVLQAYGLEKDTKQKFDLIRDMRRKYLHFFSKQHTNISKDAIKTFEATASLLTNLIGQGTSAMGEILLNPALMKYLEKHGLIVDDETESKDGEVDKTEST